MPTAPTLLLTVGGSHQPLVTAIRETRPAHVVFLCTDDMPGQKGSRIQVEGTGSCILAAPRDERPSLPAIPVQCGLAAGQWTLAIVPADDLDGAVAAMGRAIADQRRSRPHAALIADFTGGTKTMGAALMLAALEAEDIRLQIVTGNRPDLRQVRDAMPMVAPVRVEALRLRRDMALCMAAWAHHGYDQAASALAALAVPGDPSLRRNLQWARVLSAGMAAWDRFDHAGAQALLAGYESQLAPWLGARWASLKIIAENEEGDRRVAPLRLWDLWLNAQRRARAGRHDDAVARAYRLLEWTAQWLLASERGWHTADLPADVALAAGIPANRNGQYQAGLYAAWQLAATHVGGIVADFFAAQEGPMRDHVQHRNHSILAHGFTPLTAAQWQEFSTWLQGALVPLLTGLLARQRLKPFAQLPDAPLDPGTPP